MGSRSGQRLGPGGSGPRAQPPAWPHLAQTRLPGTAQSPAVRLNGLLVLGRKLSPAGPQVVGVEGGKWAWLRALAGLEGSPLLWPGLSHSLSPSVFTALAFGQASQVTFLSYRAIFFCGAHCPPFIWAPISLPLPSGPLPHLLMPSTFDQEILPGFSKHLPPPTCRPWHHMSLTNAGTSGISPGNSLALWQDTTLRSTLVTHTGTSEWRWPHATDGTSGRACMNTVPASGLFRQHMSSISPGHAASLGPAGYPHIHGPAAGWPLIHLCLRPC